MRTPSTWDRQFIGRIRTAMRAKGFSNADLARRLKLPDSTVKRWLDCTSVPRLQQLVPIARALDVSAAYLLGVSDSSAVPDEDALRVAAKVEAEAEISARVLAALAPAKARR